jgi:antitoxin (DNA-binding transcriptional repressor) of toxin-antitoxin stability system
MAQIGVRALKAQLSEHLRRAQAGERYLVTDRGIVIATLGPAAAPKLGLHPRIPARGSLASAMVIEDRR